MSAIPLRKEDAFPTPVLVHSSPAHPAAPAIEERTRKAAAKAPATGTGYRRVRAPEWLVSAMAMALGIAACIGVWAIVSKFNSSIPAPGIVWDAAVKIFSDPFYRKGPNDQGIGWNVLMSLQRVGIGFGAAALAQVDVLKQTERRAA